MPRSRTGETAGRSSCPPAAARISNSALRRHPLAARPETRTLMAPIDSFMSDLGNRSLS